MLKPNEIEKVSMALDEPMRSLENQIMTDIVRRIKINGGITRSADWQIYRLHELGMAKEDIQKAIQRHSTHRYVLPVLCTLCIIISKHTVLEVYVELVVTLRHTVVESKSINQIIKAIFKV